MRSGKVTTHPLSTSTPTIFRWKMALAPGPGTAAAARTTWRSCSPSSRGSSATPFTRTAVASTPMTAWLSAFSTRPAPGPDGDRFDNTAVYTFRLRPDGQADRIWTVDLDAEHCEGFWQKNPGQPSKDFS